MSDSENIDLSKLKIQRGNPTSSVPTRSKTGLILYTAGGLFLLLLLFFFIRTTLTGEEEVEVTAVTRISSSQASSVLTASGYVVAQRKASIASKATGRIVSLGFHEGDKVTKGEIIARIESADMEAGLAQAQADLAVAKADMNDARQSLDRSKQLLDRGLIAQAEYDAAKARYDRVVASIASRNAAVNAAEVSLENTRIRAPFDGTILTKNADVGEVVAPFAAGASSRVAVVTLADMLSLEVEADVSESNIEHITVGQPCEIMLDAYPDQRYRGVVDKIVPTADRAKATVLTKIRFIEKDSRVLPEMSAKVHFLSTQASENNDNQLKTVVDLAAVVTRNGKKIVFVFQENKITERAVEVGSTLGKYIEVKRGLSQGEKVVLHPSEKLESGSKAKLKTSYKVPL